MHLSALGVATVLSIGDGFGVVDDIEVDGVGILVEQGFDCVLPLLVSVVRITAAVLSCPWIFNWDGLDVDLSHKKHNAEGLDVHLSVVGDLFCVALEQWKLSVMAGMKDDEG